MQTSPPLCAVPGLLVRVPVGPTPSLHSLRRPRRTSAFVRALLRYYGSVRLPVPVHRGRTPLGFSSRTPAPARAGHGISLFPGRRFRARSGSQTAPGPAASCAYRCGRCCLPHFGTGSAPESGDFAAPYLARTCPCQRFGFPSRVGRMTRGQRGALLLTLYGSFIRSVLPVNQALSPISDFRFPISKS